MDSPCSCACWIAFQRASCRGVGARNCALVAGRAVVLLLATSAVAAVRSAGSRRSAPPEPSPEAIRSWSGSCASSERTARSTPARGGASREGILSSWCRTERPHQRRASHAADGPRTRHLTGAVLIPDDTGANGCVQTPTPRTRNRRTSGDGRNSLLSPGAAGYRGETSRRDHRPGCSPSPHCSRTRPTPRVSDDVT